MINPAFKQVPSVIEALRDATRSRHAQLAASPAMVRLFDAEYTISEYRAHLGRLLGLFEPLERAIADAVDGLDFVGALERSSALLQDLRTMGVTTNDIDSLERYRGFSTFPPTGLRGYAYVILGSMMGGKIIVKQLRAVLGADASFQFYGDGQGRPKAQWESYCSDLEENGENDVQAICATAVTIFDAYTVWLSEPLLPVGNH